MAIKLTRLGGTLTLGDIPGLDVSAQVVGVSLGSELETGDPLTVLNGETVSSGLTTTATLSGTMIIDPYAGGVTEWTHTNHGTEQTFTLTIDTPNAAAGIVATGKVLVSKLAIGGETHGEVMQSEFEWSVVGEPEVTFPTATP